MDIKITIEGLDQMTEAVATLAAAIGYQPEELRPAKPTKEEAERVMDAAIAADEAKQDVVPANQDVKAERAEIKKLFAEKIKTTSVDNLRSIIADVGAENISALRPEFFAQVREALENL